MRARNLAPKTIRAYGESADQLVVALAETGVTEVQAVTREHLSDSITGLLATRSPSTASVPCRALQQFVTWLVDEEEIAVSPMAKLRPPKIEDQLTPVLDDAAITTRRARSRATNDEETAEQSRGGRVADVVEGSACVAAAARQPCAHRVVVGRGGRVDGAVVR